jgi:hypothetical protein
MLRPRLDQVLLLALIELGAVDGEQRLAGRDHLPGAVDEQLLDPARHPDLDALEACLVGRDEPHQVEPGPDRALRHDRRAHADQLHPLRRDAHRGETRHVAVCGG